MLNVLYVEDDLGSRDVVKMVERMNPGLMQVLMWEDSSNFIERLLALPIIPDVILLDIHVAPYTGFDMLRFIREQANFTSVVVIALTASVMNEEVEMLKTAGFQGVFSKPLDMDAFPDLIMRVINGENIWYVW